MITKRELSFRISSGEIPPQGARTTGATLIEYAIVLPLLLALIFVIIELARYWAVQGLINQGAQRGVSLAIRISNLEYESTDSTAEYRDFAEAYGKITAEAEALPKAAFVRNFDATSSSAFFVGFAADQAPDGQARNTALLRPGECKTDRDGVLHCHPTLCPQTDPCNSGAARRTPGSRMVNLLREHPVVLIAPVRFRPIVSLPLWGDLHPVGLAAGYRENFKTGAFPIPESAPPPAPTATPTPPGPDYTPPPTVTPGPTRTPRPSPTPTAVCEPPWPSCVPQCPYCTHGGWICGVCGGLDL